MIKGLSVMKSIPLMTARYNLDINELKLLNIAFAVKNEDGVALIPLDEIIQYTTINKRSPVKSLERIGINLINSKAKITEDDNEYEIKLVEDFHYNKGLRTITIVLSDDVLKHII